MTTLLAFAALLLVLVLAHEAGHAVLARLFRCRVEEFGFGFPPRLTSVRVGETVFSLNALPLGGFVRLTGEDGNDVSDPQSFARKSRLVKAAILLGGITCNLLLAWVVFSLVAGLGIDIPAAGQPGNLANLETRVVAFQDPSPALMSSGLTIRDTILAVNEVSVTSAAETAARVREAVGSELKLLVRRGRETLTVSLKFERPKVAGERIGLALLDVGTVKVPWRQAPRQGARRTLETASLTVRGLGRLARDLVIDHRLSEDLSGPVGIAALTGAVVKQGFTPFLELGAILSVNLALINLLPIPALDGGRVLFLALESLGLRHLRGRPERLAHSIGFVVLLLLLLFVTLSDIQKLVR